MFCEPCPTLTKIGVFDQPLAAKVYKGGVDKDVDVSIDVVKMYTRQLLNPTENIMTVLIEEWGNDAALRLPKDILDALSLEIGDLVNIVQKGNSVVIEPCKPSLDGLLVKVNAHNRHNEVFTDSAGNELL